MHKKRIGGKDYFYTSVRDNAGKIETIYLGSNKNDARRKAKSLGVNSNNKSNFFSVDSLNLQRSMFALLIVFLVFFFIFGMKNVELTGFVVEDSGSDVDEEVAEEVEEVDEETTEEEVVEEDSGGGEEEEEETEDVQEELPEEDAVPQDFGDNETEEINLTEDINITEEEVNETLEINETEIEDVIDNRDSSVSNMTINTSEANMSLNIPIANGSLNLTNETTINAVEVNLTNNLTANITDTYTSVTINKQVVWKKKVVLDEEISDLIVELDPKATDINVIGFEDNISIEVTNDENISETIEESVPLITGQATFNVNSVFSKVVEFFKNFFSGIPTGYVVHEEEMIEIVIEGAVKEVEIEYQLPGPTSEETEITEHKKQITVSSDIHYENILTYTEIKESPVESINLYWIINDTRTKQEFTPYDTNDNELIDYIEWITPHLSNQTYEVEITILNLNTFVEQGNNWTVMFNTTGTANLTITAVNDASQELPPPRNHSGWDTKWTIYDNVGEDYDLKFLELKCGEEVLDYVWDEEEESVFVQNYSCNDTGYEVGLKWANTTTDIALRFDYGGQVRYAYDAVSCGDYLTVDTTLTEDLTDCTGHGLVMNLNGITLDCAGHTIDGDDGTSDAGVHANQKDNLVIKNCVVEDFGIGIYGYNMENSLVINNNVSSSSNYGIALYGSADGLTEKNVIENNTIINSAVYQIRRAGYVNNNNFTGNVINSSTGDGIMFYAGRQYGDRFVDNAIEISADSWEYGVYVYKPTTVFENVTFINNTVLANAYGQYGVRIIAGNGAIRNFLFENTNVTTNGTSSSYAIEFAGYPDTGEISGTVVRNSVLNATDSLSIMYRGNSTDGPPNLFNNYFVDTKLYSDEAYSLYFDDFGDNGVNNITMLNTTYNGYLRFIGGSTAGMIFTDWHLEFYVNSTSGSALEGANVSAWDRNGNFVFSGLTDVDGMFRRNLTEYNQTDDYDYDYYTNYTINATHPSSSGNYTGQLNLTDNIRLNITLVMGGVVPNDPNPLLSSLDGSNGTFSDLNCSSTISDPNGDDLNVSVKWYNNSVLWLSEDFNNSYSSGTLFNATLGSGNLSVGENWTCGMRLSDNDGLGNWVNSTNLTILSAASCLETITTSTTLDSDLDCPGVAHGLQIGASDIFLDCAGHMIKGDDTAGSRGIRAVTSYNNVTVKNCVVEDFDYGIILYPTNSTISNNTVNSTLSYGILAYSSTAFLENTVIANNTVLDADTYSISIYNDGNNPFINFNVTNNFVNDTVGDGIMVLRGHQYGHIIKDNYVELSEDTSEYGLLIYTPEDGGFENLSYINNTIVTYASGQYGVRIAPDRFSNISNILFDGNNITTASYGFGIDHEYYSTLNSSAHDIIFKNGIINSGSYAIRYYANTTDRETIPNLYNIYFIDSEISGSTNIAYVGDRSTSVSPNNLTFVNCTLNDHDFNFVAANDASFYVKEYLDVYVSNTSGDIENANVTTWDKDNNFVFSELTDAGGFITRQNVTSYNQTNDAVYSFYSNYTMNTSLPQYTDTRELNITSYLQENVTPNQLPYLSTIILNSTSLTNLTSEDLHCYFSVRDHDSEDDLYANYTWYENDVAKLSGQISVTHDVTTSIVLGSGNTTKGENWNCNVTPYDSEAYGSSAESVKLTILNTAPNKVVLKSPKNASSTTDRTPDISWYNPGDDDNDALTYDLWVDNDFNFLSPEIKLVKAAGVGYTPTDDLDVDTTYYWRVRAWDGEIYGEYSLVWEFDIDSYVAITIPNDTMNFGTITRDVYYDTETGDPGPFVVQNDGNALVNITSVGTKLFDEAGSETEYYQCKADDVSGEEGAFDSETSLMDWVNVTFGLFGVGDENKVVNFLQYPDNNDSVEIDVRIKAPLDEEATSKLSVMTFTAALTEGGV